MAKRYFPYEFIEDREKIDETSLPEKEEFYNYLNMEDNTDADYTYRKRICKDFNIKKLSKTS